MKHLYILFSFVLVSLFVVEPLQAQQEITIRELNEYDAPLTDQSEISEHPLAGTEVTFEAVVVSYPRNSGLSTPDEGPSGAEPELIHLFVTDVNAIDEGREGMSTRMSVGGTEMRALESLDRGDVIRVTGELTFYGNESQFDAFEVEPLGSIELNAEYEDLAPLLEPIELDLTEINQSVGNNTHAWVAENYSKYINSYVKFTGLEMIARLAGEDGNRPWFALSDGNTVIVSSDISLRYRNDRQTYGFLVEDDSGVQDTVLSLNYNYRRKAEDLDGIFNPPAPGSVVDVSGFLVLDDFLPPAGFDEVANERVFRIVPWEDGIRWTADGDDVANRITDGIPNDLVVQGYAPLIDNLTLTPDSEIVNSDEVTLSVDVLLPEDDYTINSVELTYSAPGYDEVTSDTVTVDMTGSGDTYSFTFDSYPDFTTVHYAIAATAETPDGVETTARESGSFSVVSATQTSPAVFSPEAGDYENQVAVELSSATPDADIYYTLDGSDPTVDSEEYSSAINLNETTTIKAIAVSDGMDDSPIAERTYNVVTAATEVSTIAGIKSGAAGESYLYTGEAVVVYTQSFRSQKYIMDATGGILIDDNDGVITSDYEIGDVITGLLGEKNIHNGTVQFVPATDPGAPTETTEIDPQEVTLADLDADQHQSMLVTIKDVTFASTGSFETGSDYAITDPSLEDGETVNFRTNFYDADYIGTDIPQGAMNITGIVSQFSGDPQITPRSLADMTASTSIEDNGLPNEFALSQNYPNPFNPTTNIRYSVAEIADVNLVVYDILGRKVATLVNEVKSPGAYMVNFNASRLSSGAYFYRLEAGDFVSIRKMMLIK